MSEYKRQFKAWSVPSSTSGAIKGKAEGNKKEKNEIGEYGKLEIFIVSMNHLQYTVLAVHRKRSVKIKKKKFWNELIFCRVAFFVYIYV